MNPKLKGAATQQRIVEAMLELVQVHGYSGTGLNNVIAHSGAPKGSLYFHFPQGKEQLGEQAVVLAGTQFEDMIRGALGSAGPGESAGEIVESVTASLAQLLEGSDFRVGCPVSVVTLEMGAESERLRSACEQAYESWIVPVTEFLMARGHGASVARATASAVVSLVEGAMIVSRARRDVQPLRDAAVTLRTLLDLPADRTSAEA
ncbi:TetR/AcrR family transcriptional regulator [Antrihabitans stalagmiti]|nr:TetR/AcrR family transcriptional regulator [Antrihabitans stalagmiti]